MNTLKSKQIQILLIIVFSSSQLLFSQETETSCKVLLKEISGFYKGNCKDGLADGKGVSSGVDTYSGYFKNGMPEGKGVYKYKDGSIFSGNFKNGLKNGKGEFKYYVDKKSTIVSGYWKDGDYIGVYTNEDEYRVTNKSGIESCTIKKSESKDDVIELVFQRHLTEKYMPLDLIITTSSGEIFQGNQIVVVRNYAFPVNCSVEFKLLLGVCTKQCFLTFDVLKPGKYVVEISNN